MKAARGPGQLALPSSPCQRTKVDECGTRCGLERLSYTRERWLAGSRDRTLSLLRTMHFRATRASAPGRARPVPVDRAASTGSRVSSLLRDGTSGWPGASPGRRTGRRRSVSHVPVQDLMQGQRAKQQRRKTHYAPPQVSSGSRGGPAHGICLVQHRGTTAGS